MNAPNLQKGDYVLATKYVDGDPQDHWAVGFYESLTAHEPPRHNIVDSNGKLFRGNGFRRVKKISAERGEWLLQNAKLIESSGRSVWWWVRANMRGCMSNVQRKKI